MREVLEDLRNVREKADEVEEGYFKRLKNSIFRCGNINNEDEKMSIYVDGLSDTVLMEVARYLESGNQRDLTFERLCQYVK